MTDVPQNPQQPEQPQQPEPPAPPAYGQAPYGQASAPGEQQPSYGQAPYGQGYPQAPAYGQTAQETTQPGKTMGIVAFVLALAGLVTGGLASLVGLILGIIALVQSKKAGLKNGLALAAIIIGAIVVVLVIVAIIVFISWAVSLGAAVNSCLADPSGTVEVWGIQFSCSQLVSGSSY